VIVLVMGVSGSGKSTVGTLLSQRLGYEFIDADEHHPPANVEKMAAGVPLEDADRWPWLDRLNSLLRSKSDAVLACSALKKIYRERLLRGIAEHRIVYLQGSAELIASRLAGRQHRYMPASLLESQFAILEPPASAIAVDIDCAPAQCVERIVAAL
jgi:gluconokinase